MKIGINFEDTLTDSNYSLIDVINKRRRYRDDFIDYEDFDESGYHSIWDYPFITEEELESKNDILLEVFETLDLVTLAKIEIIDLLKEGNIFQIFTEYDIDLKNEIENFLTEKGLTSIKNNIVYGVTEENVTDTLKKHNLDIYIEDNPYIIKECNGVDPLIIVRSHNYNETCYNLMRLECYSQLGALLKRSVSKIEKHKLKREKEFEREEIKRIREAVRGVNLD